MADGLDAVSVLGQTSAPNIAALSTALDSGSNSTPQEDSYGLDSSKLVGAFNAATDSITSSVADLSGLLKGATAAGNQKQQGIQQQSEATQQLNTLDQQVKMKAQARTAHEAGALGTDPDAASYVVTDIASSIGADERDIMERQSMIQSKMDQSFLDDPLQWITNQFSLPYDQAALEMKVGSVSQKFDTLRQLSARTTEFAQKNAALEENASTARLAALNQQAAGKALADVADSKMQLATLGIQGLQVKSALDERQFTNIMQMNTAKNEAVRLSLAQTSEQLHARQVDIMASYRDIQKKALNLSIEQRQDNIDALNSLQKNLDRVTSIYGMRQISAKDFMSPSFSPRMKETIQQLMLDPNTQDGKLGYNAVGSLERVNSINAPLTPGMNILRDRLTKIEQGIIATPMNQQLFKTMTPDQRMAIVQKGIDAEVLKEQNNIPQQRGIYSPPALKDVITTPALLKMAPILTGAKSGLPSLAMADPQHPLNANEIFKFAMEQIATKQATVEQMGKEVSSIYRTANALNAETLQYNRFALPAPVDSHKTTLYTGVGFGGAKVVDMANPIAVQSELIRSIANLQRMKEISQSP